MKAPKRTKEIELDGDYKGFKFTANLSVPMSVFTYIQTGNWALIQSAMHMIVIDWNFVDVEGKSLPPPGEMIPALDMFGDPVIISKTNPDGTTTENPVMVTATSLVSPELGMLMIEKLSQNIINVSDP